MVDEPSGSAEALGLRDSVTVEVRDEAPLRSPDLLAAYMRAVERVRTQVTGPDRQTPTIGGGSLALAAICEALEWADTLEQHLSHPPRGNSRGWIAPPEGDQALLVRAFGRVRNVVHHRWWKAVTYRVTDSGDGSQQTHWIWSPLPRSATVGRGKDADGAAAYDAVLAGHVILDTLDELACAFWPSRGWAVTIEDLRQPGHEVGTPLALDSR